MCRTYSPEPDESVMTQEMGHVFKKVFLITLLPGSPCYLGGSFDADLCSDTCDAVNVGRDAIKKVLFGNSMVFQVFGTELRFQKYSRAHGPNFSFR